MTIPLCDVNHVSTAGEGRQDIDRLTGLHAAVCRRARRSRRTGTSSGSEPSPGRDPRTREPLRPARPTVVPGRNATDLRLDARGRSRGREVAHRHLDSVGLDRGLSHGSATDRAHRAVGLDEVRVVDAVAGGLAPHRGAPRRLDRVVGGAAAQQPRAGRSPGRRTGSCGSGRRRSSRVRSHAAQKACETDAMTPNLPLGVPGPASTSHSSAGADPRGAGSGRSRKCRRSAASTSSALDRRAAAPLVPGVERHLLDDAQLIAVLQAEPQQRHRVLPAGAGIQHGVDLHRRQAGRVGGGQAVEHVGEPVAPGDGGEMCGGPRCPARR